MIITIMITIMLSRCKIRKIRAASWAAGVSEAMATIAMASVRSPLAIARYE